MIAERQTTSLTSFAPLEEIDQFGLPTYYGDEGTSRYANRKLSAATLESILRTLAIDFDGLPLYVCLQSDGLPEEFWATDSYGSFGPNLDIALRPWLESKGRWHGRGPALVILDDRIAIDMDDQAGDDPTLTAELIRQRVLGTLLHEAAHALSRDFDAAERTPQEVTFYKTLITVLCAVKLPTSSPMVGHDAVFIRAVLHLAERYQLYFDERIPASLLFDGRNYALSSVWQYRGALGDEPRQQYRASFAELRCLPPPQEFSGLYAQDVNRWNQQKEGEENVT